MAKIKGICKNIDGDCSLAFNKTVQEAEKDDFVCSECGAPLKEAASEPSPRPKKLIPIIIGAVVAVGAVIGSGFAMGWFDSTTEPAPATVIEAENNSADNDTTTNIVATDTVSTAITPAEEPVVKEAAAKKEEVKENPQTNATTASGKNLGYGNYSGSYPTGVGTIKINRSHTFETTNGSVDAAPGDMVVSAKFKDGKLIQGELHRADGSRVWMTFGAI